MAVTSVIDSSRNGNFNNIDVTDSITLNNESILDIVYPVGSIYISTTSPNPLASVGFGTWVAYGAGRVLVGVGTGFAAGALGGEATHSLSVAEMPAHNHTYTVNAAGAHTHSGSTLSSAGSHQHTFRTVSSGWGNSGLERRSYSSITTASLYTTSNGAHTHSNYSADYGGSHVHTITLANNGSGTPHENRQPYIVVYMWERTA